MICRNVHRNFIITKSQGKFTSSGELIVLPAFEIAVHAHTRKPLCDGVQIIAVFGEIFVTTAAAHRYPVWNVVIPIDLKDEFFAAL